MTRDIVVKAGWDSLGDTGPLRRNREGLERFKEMLRDEDHCNPLTLNAFFYAYVVPAKNVDLYTAEDLYEVAEFLPDLERRMRWLDDFERSGRNFSDTDLKHKYLQLRAVVVRKSSGNERRVLATLLFSGPGSVQEIANDLPAISENLVGRTLQALGSVVDKREGGTIALKTDADSLAIVLYLLRSTLGVDPVSVLRRSIRAQEIGGADA